jgi:hypothetical protein
MAYAYFDLVQRAFDDLKREGLIAPRTNQDAIEQDKGLLTRRAAYYIHSQHDASIGLLEKTSGNNSLGYSVDWHVRQSDGEGWDVATDDGTQALPVNGSPHGPNAENIPRWRQPTAELAQMPDGGTTPPTPEPDDDDLAEQVANLTAAVEALQAIVVGQSAKIDWMITQTWHGDCAIGMRMNFGMICPPMPAE